MLNERAGFVSFWLVQIGFNVTFLGMFAVGLSGQPRRVVHYDNMFAVGNLVSTMGAYTIGIGMLVLLYAVVSSCATVRLLWQTRGAARPWSGRSPIQSRWRTLRCSRSSSPTRMATARGIRVAAAARATRTGRGCRRRRDAAQDRDGNERRDAAVTSISVGAPLPHIEDPDVVGRRWRTGVLLLILADASFVAALCFPISTCAVSTRSGRGWRADSPRRRSGSAGRSPREP